MAPIHRLQAPAELPQPPEEAVPASPLELLRRMASAEGRAAAAAAQARVRTSYKVLEGCPWVAPRPLYVLASEQQHAPGGIGGEGAPGLAYSMRTRMARRDTGDELSQLLRRRRPDGMPLISCSEMRDGVVAFEDDADAERFAQALEVDGLAGRPGGARDPGVPAITIARCYSHALFRGVADARGVVVLLRRGVALPRPHELAASLRAQEALEDEAGSVK